MFRPTDAAVFSSLCVSVAPRLCVTFARAPFRIVRIRNIRFEQLTE